MNQSCFACNWSGDRLRCVVKTDDLDIVEYCPKCGQELYRKDIQSIVRCGK